MTTERTLSEKLQATRTQETLLTNPDYRRYSIALCVASTARMAVDLMKICQVCDQLTDIPPDVAESMNYLEKKIRDEFYKQLGCELVGE